MEEFQLEKLNIDLGEEFKEVKKSLESLNKSIEQLKSFTNDPKNMIFEYFSEIRNKIDIDRETIKGKIDNHYLGLIDELKIIEADQIKTELKNIDDFVNEVNKAEIHLAEFKKELDVPKFDTKKWSDIRFESNNQIAGIKRKINDLENELLSNKRFTYENNDFDNENLNKAKIIQTVMKRKENFEEFGSFHVIKRNFENFRKTHDEYEIFNSKAYYFNRMYWFMELEESDGNNLGCYIHCQIGTYKEVSAIVKVSLNNIRDPEKNKFIEFEHKYTNDFGYGEDVFISFKDIFDNGFYDRENDSINLSVFIHILQIYK